jgi:monofunctional biosynthetic peptidoglycan transglycosylase
MAVRPLVHTNRVKKSARAMRNRRVRIRDWVLLVLGAWLLTVLIYRIVAPPFTPLMAIRKAQSIFSVSDYRGYREWRWIKIKALPTHITQAVVTAEDARFMGHFGVDFGAVVDVIDDAGESRSIRGASTITMQTVKNLFLWPGGGYIRKPIEWILSPVAGALWGKRRTLELYINIVEWGDGIYGIEAAARHYFHKPARDLSAHEAAALAAILPNPRKFSPIRMNHSTRLRYQRIIREMQATRVP